MTEGGGRCGPMDGPMGREAGPTGALTPACSSARMREAQQQQRA